MKQFGAVLSILVLWVSCAPAPELAEKEEAQQPIIGGWPDSEHPAVGALRSQTSLCTGTLITPRIVLTAAHCIHADNPMKYFVLGPDVDNPTEVNDVSTCVAHSGYAEAEIDHHILKIHDMAICVLSTPSAVTPMKYRKGSVSNLTGTKVTFVGFGRRDPHDGESSGVKYAVTEEIATMTSEGFFNKTGPEAPRNTCSGDSGGPVVLKILGFDEVAGVVSGGDEFCVYDGWNIRVDPHKDWIKQQILQYDPEGLPAPVCGDLVCEGEETEAVCPQDCKAGCGDLTWQGCCEGHIVHWCDDGIAKSASCAENLHCGWNASSDVYDCDTSGGEDPSGANPRSCNPCGDGICGPGEGPTNCPEDCTRAGCMDVGFAGCCDGEQVLWCDDGTLNALHCGNNPKCGWRDDKGYYDCGTAGNMDPSGGHPQSCTGNDGGGGGSTCAAAQGARAEGWPSALILLTFVGRAW